MRDYQKKNDSVERIKQETVEYKGSSISFKENRNKAMLGSVAWLIGANIHPVFGLAALTYTGIKADQAYNDYEQVK